MKMVKVENDSTRARRRPTLLVVHGEKGGVGKSFAALLAASTALHHGLVVHVIETDSGIPDVGPIFFNRPGSDASKIALDRDVEAGETLGNLLNGVENLLSSETPPEFIAINSPAGASAVLDGFADIFATVADTLNLDLTVAFLVDDSQAVLPRIESSISTGLLSIPTARRAFIYSGWRGDSSRFPLASAPARTMALENGVVEFVFPALNPASLYKSAKEMKRPFYDLLAPDAGLRIVDRSLLARWLASCEPLSNWLIGSTHG